MNSIRLAAGLTLAACCVLMSSCSNDDGEVHKSNLSGLVAYYGQYQAKSRGQLPPNENALKEFIAADLSAAGVPTSADKIDAIFVSNRDGKPFVVRYGGDKSWQYPNLVAYEQEVHQGVRHVGYAMGGVEALTEEQFRKMLVPSTVQR